MLSNHQYENRKLYARNLCEPEKQKLIAHLAQLDEEFAYIKADAEALIAKLDEMIESDDYDYSAITSFHYYLAAVNAVFENPSEHNQQELYKSANALHDLEYSNSQILSFVTLGMGLAILLGAIITAAIFAATSAFTFGIAGIVICAVLLGLSATGFATSAGSLLYRGLNDGASNRMLKLAEPTAFADIHENYCRKNPGKATLFNGDNNSKPKAEDSTQPGNNPTNR